MDNIPQPIATFKDRRGGLIAFGVFQLLIAACLFLFAAFVLFLPAAELAKSQPPGTPPPPMGLAAALYGVMGAVFAAIGIGSILAKNWARIGTLIVCWFWLASGVISILLGAVALPTILRNAPPPQQNLPANFGHTMLVVILIFGGVFGVVLPGIFLLFYHSKNVKATVLQGQPAAASQRPILMTILIVWFCVAALSTFFTASLKYPAIFFGMILWGWKGKLVLILFGAAYAFVAWAYVKADVRGWWTVVALQALGVASFILTFAGQNLTDVYRRMGMTEQQLAFFKDEKFAHGFVIFMALFMMIFLGLIIYSKRYFPPQPPSASGQLA